MKKKILAFLVCAVVMLSVAGCNAKYNEKEFIGKSSAQIEAEFGKFDCIEWPASEDGLYRNTSCGYTIREPHESFFGTTEEWLVFIVFDENGIAVKCEEGYRPGG